MDREVFTRMAQIEGRHWWFRGRRKIVQEQLSNWGLPEHCEILEAGCGTGGNLAMLSRWGSISGFEPDQPALEVAQRLGVGDVRAGSLPDAIPFAGKLFDLIVATDVLEHVEDDTAALAALSERLRPGGKILVTVPANAWMWSRHDEIHHHFRRYQKNELLGKLESTGLSVQYCSFFNTWLLPAIVLTRLVKVHAKLKRGDESEIPSRLINQILFGIFQSERFVLNNWRFPFGVSLLLRAERTPVLDREA